MKIIDVDFSLEFKYVMRHLGIKTISQAKKFLIKIHPKLKIGNIRAYKLQRELKDYIISIQEKG